MPNSAFPTHNLSLRDDKGSDLFLISSAVVALRRLVIALFPIIPTVEVDTANIWIVVTIVAVKVLELALLNKGRKEELGAIHELRDTTLRL